MSVESIRDQAITARNQLADGDKQLTEAETHRASLLATVQQIAKLLDEALVLAGEQFESDAVGMDNGVRAGNEAYRVAASTIVRLWLDTDNPYPAEAREWSIKARDQTSWRESGEASGKIFQDQMRITEGLEDLRTLVRNMITNAAALQPDIAVTLMSSSAAAAALDGYVGDISS